MTAYFTALDHAQHESGPFSAEAKATLERIDGIVGTLVRAAHTSSGGRASSAWFRTTGSSRRVAP